jgi:ankyrin repeat protein
MRDRKVVRSLWLLLLVVVIGTPLWRSYRKVRQKQRDHALIEAVKRKDTSAVLSLLDQGADVRARDTPPEQGSVWHQIVENLPGQSPVISNDPNYSPGWPALMLAVSYDDLPTVKTLLDHGANVHAFNRFQQPVLLIAAMSAHLPVLQALLDKGADVRSRDMRGDTTLTAAATANNIGLVAALVSRHIDASAHNIEGMTALQIAACAGRVDFVQALLAGQGKALLTKADKLTTLRRVSAIRAALIAHQVPPLPLQPALPRLPSGASMITPTATLQQPLLTRYTAIITLLKQAGAQE